MVEGHEAWIAAISSSVTGMPRYLKAMPMFLLRILFVFPSALTEKASEQKDGRSKAN